jgi:hypothetical protein
MSLQFRRGKEAIAKANESKSSSGSFTPYLPNIIWKDDKQSRLIWILNPLDDIPTVAMIKAFTTDKRVEYAVSRKDDAIGHSSDPIEDKWGYGPADLGIAIAVELEAVTETRRGRERPVSFRVATRDFTRRVRNSKGEITQEKEEVTAPVVGVICQSPSNFFNHLSTKDSTVGPIHQLPLQIIRDGDDKDTDYEVEAFEEKPLDAADLLDFWENISYLTEEDKDEIHALFESAEDEEEYPEIIGAVLLDKWLNEHASQEWYDQIASKIDAPAKFPSKKYIEAKGKGEEPEKRERPARSSQLRSRRAAEPENDEGPDDDETEDAPQVTQTESSDVDGDEDMDSVEEPKARRRSTPRNKSKDTSGETDKSNVSKSSPIKERMEALLVENAKRAAA